MADETPAEFLKRTTGRGKPGGDATETPETPAEFLARTAPKGAETKKADLPPPPYGVPPSEYDPNDIAPDPRVLKSFEGFPAMRNALAVEPGYVRPPWPLSMLPLSFKETTPGSGRIDPSSGLSGLKYDPGSTVSSLGANALLDLLEGTGFAESAGGMAAPKAGQVTPEATMLLLGGMMGNPIQQFRHPLEAPGRDIRFGAPEARPPSAGDIAAAPLPPEFTAAPMTPEARATIAARTAPASEAPPPVEGTTSGGPETQPPATPEPAPSTPTGIPVVAPRSVGAAGVGGYEAIHTPAEEAGYRANAEGQKLLEPQKIGERDINQYIPGETVNNAEREQTVKTARELKELGIRVPEASQIDKEAAESNNTARTVYARNTSKGQVEITNRQTARENDITADKATVFAPENVKGPVDHGPIVEEIQKIVSDPENKQNDAVQSVLRPIMERLQDEKGAGKISDPLEMWGLRRQIDRWTSKRSQSEDLNLHYAAGQLSRVADVIDAQIEKVAPGYKDMLATYKEHSRAISEMTVLQDMFDKLRGPGQKLTYNDFQRFMKNVVDSRMTAASDLNPFKAISDENMTRLWNIRDSLRRSASAKELAQAAGSDTMPNIIDALKAVGKMGGVGAMHAYAGAHLGPVGNLALQSLTALGKGLNDRRMINRATRQMNQLMNPTEPLRPPPGQENPLTGAGPP
jgi:hypothetical protein